MTESISDSTSVVSGVIAQFCIYISGSGFNLVHIYLNWSFATKNAHKNPKLQFIGIYLLNRTIKIFERTGNDLDQIPFTIGYVNHAPLLHHLAVVNTAKNPVDFRFLRSEEHTSELQSRGHLVCRLLLERE